jgi:hypothetical protein
MRDPSFDPTAAVVLVDSATADRESLNTRSASDSATLGGSVRPRLSSDGLAVQQAKTDVLLYEPEHIVATVTAPTDGWLVLSDSWYPGWEAIVDDEPVAVERANILFRAVAVPAGDHRVEWIYRPTFFLVGAAISMVGVSLLLIGAVWVGLSRWCKRKRLSA